MDEQDYRTVRLQDLRKQMSVIPQSSTYSLGALATT